MLRGVVGSSISVALRSFVMVLGSIVMMFVTQPRLAAWTLVGIPLFVLPIIVGSRRLRKISRQSQDRVADANALASEVIGAIRTVQAHAREPYERERFFGAVATAVATASFRVANSAVNVKRSRLDAPTSPPTAHPTSIDMRMNVAARAAVEAN